MEHRPTRRTVVGGLLCGATAAVAGAAILVARDDAGRGDGRGGGSSPESGASAPVSDEDALVAVGTRYLRDHPDEAGRDQLTAALGLPATAHPSPIEVLASSGEQIEQDFASGDVATVDGWILSLTEARVAALAALEA